VTVHCGEEGFPEEIGEVVEALRPDRIGHGILAAGDPELTSLLAGTGIVLEVCPTSNLLTGALADAEEVRTVFRTFLDAGVRVTVSTDGPEMMRTHLRDEFVFLCSIGALSEDEARAANALAHEVSFVGPRLAARL
jgi:adenosine deaminase